MEEGGREMPVRFLGIAIAALAATAPGMAQSPTPAAPPASAAVDQTTQTEDVAFRTDSDDRMTVPVRLSGMGPFRFLIDTGADRTAISSQLASRLNYLPGEIAAVHSIAGVSRIATTTVPSLQLTRNEIRNIQAPLLNGVYMGADGILGTDSLRAQRVMFDFEAQTLSIVPSALPDFRYEPGTIVVRGTRRNGRLVVTDATANGNKVIVVVDTGSQVTIGNTAMRKVLMRDRMLSDPQQVVIESVTGQKIAGEYMFVRELQVGGVQLRNLAVVFMDAHTFRQLKLDKRPALLLGMNAMKAFKKVSIDFATRKLRVVVPEHSSLDLRLASK
jgi:predicted aspartyl protease